jgi:hypothetical protein
MQQNASNSGFSGFNWPSIHTSALWQAPAQRAVATLLDGAVRYACPVNGSRVFITDPAALAAIKPPLARMRCIGCGEMHLLDLAGA